MKYEIQHGTLTRYTEAGNEYQACMDVLADEATEDDVQLGPFQVCELPLGKVSTIDMHTVISLGILAVNPLEEGLTTESLVVE
jgi:hypothetical protein